MLLSAATGGAVAVAVAGAVGPGRHRRPEAAKQPCGALDKKMVQCSVEPRRLLVRLSKLPDETDELSNCLSTVSVNSF